MGLEAKQSVRVTTFSLLAVASLAVEIATWDTRPLWRSVLIGLSWTIASIGIMFVLPNSPRQQDYPPFRVIIFLVILTLIPLVAEPLRRSWTNDGSAVELQMVCGLRNLGLGLAACSRWLVCLRMACIASLFLMLFSAAMSNHPAIMILLALYTVIGSVWMMQVYWNELASVLLTSEQIVAVEIIRNNFQIPYIKLGILFIIFGLSVFVIWYGPKRTVLSLGEWLPTSGGTGAIDPYARMGIGDGPEEVAGDNARISGMVESNKMIEDNKDSLIDAISETYGPPLKTHNDYERMIASGKVEIIHNHGNLPENRKPSRDFDTARKKPKNTKKPTSREGRGMFEVEGRTPLHIRLIVYDKYDASRHQWIQARKPAHRFMEPIGRDWMRLTQFRDSANWYSLNDQHRIKTAEMKYNFLPTPTFLTHVRIHRVDRADYYDWDFEGVLTLNGRRSIPSGIVIHSDCRTAALENIPSSAFVKIYRNNSSTICGEVPDSLRTDLQVWASACVGDRPRGWEQIHALAENLRHNYSLDHQSVAPPNHPAPVLWFLKESYIGPDYLFATAMALTLRTLDYSTRVCMGFYVHPDSFDAETSHTPVRLSDLHFWPEIALTDGHWLVVEPTPGYTVLPPRDPWIVHLWKFVLAINNWIIDNALILSLIVLVSYQFVIWRLEIWDCSALMLWRYYPHRNWRDRVRFATLILERRCKWVRQGRLPQQTIRTWLKQSHFDKCSQNLYRFGIVAEFAAYASQNYSPWTDLEVNALCQEVLSQLSLARLQQLANEKN